MPSSPVIADAASARRPPRYRWLVRIGAAYVLLLAALVGVWFWWDVHSRTRLDAKIAALRAAGEPTRVEDFVLADVPDELNAARAVAAAAAVLVDSFGPDLPGTDNFFSSERALCEGLGSMLDHLMLANAEALCELRSARWLDRSNAVGLPIVLRQYRQLAKLEASAAFHAVYRGDDRAVVEHLEDGLAVAKVTSHANPPGMVYELLAAGIDGLICRAIAQIAPDLDIDVHATDAATPDKIRALIRELLDESSLPIGIHRAFRSVRIEMLDSINQIAESQVPAWVMPARNAAVMLPGLQFAGPSIRLEGLEVIDRMTGYCDAYSTANVAEAESQFRPSHLEENPSVMSAIQSVARRSLDVSGETFYMMYFERLAYRRLAAVVLAIRLFEVHHGRRPDRLAELVPDYLPAIPLDPLASGHRPLTYRPGPEGCVYSLGWNRIDDGGAPSMGPREITFPFKYDADFRELEYFPALLEHVDE